ncbi:MAG: Rieske (2Fe-2S) iron-sulfur domain protein [Mycobacterium sp.]|nr:Rieske (2Fe-2S) iron-sulfur domain protein [Mycobacterium sp.]
MSDGARTEVCPAAEFPPGEMRRVEVPGGAPIAVYNVDGRYHATADTCTHALASLVEGDLEGDEVSCPVHWARFNVRTGQPLCFPATVALAVYGVEVVDGVVTVLLNEKEENVA